MEVLLFWLLSLWSGCVSTLEMKPGPGVVNVPEGDDARLPCVHSSGHRVDGFDWRKNNGDNDKITVFEYKDGSGVTGSEFTGRVEYDPDKLASGDASIIITNTGLKDNGTYTCGLGLERTNRQEIPITLNVGAAPKPDIEDVDPTNVKGTWRLLKCTAHGVPEPELKWFNSAGKELNKSVLQSQSGLSNVELLLNVTKSDTYICVAIQEKICHQSNSTRVVNIEDTVIFDPVFEGDGAVLPCALDSKENIEGMMFYWTNDDEKVFSYNNGQEIIYGSFKGRLEYYTDELKFGNASVKIQRTQKSDSGRYSCIFPHIQKSHIILQIVEHSGWSPSVVVPVIVVLSIVIFVLLVVIIAVICCMIRSSKECAKKAESKLMDPLNPKIVPAAENNHETTGGN